VIERLEREVRVLEAIDVLVRRDRRVGARDHRSGFRRS
jgi:hypothetical protein